MAPQHEPRWGPPPLGPWAAAGAVGGRARQPRPSPAWPPVRHTRHTRLLASTACLHAGTRAHMLRHLPHACRCLSTFTHMPRTHTFLHAYTPVGMFPQPARVLPHSCTLLPAYLHTPACTLTHTYMLTHLDTPSCTLTHHHTILHAYTCLPPESPVGHVAHALDTD